MYKITKKKVSEKLILIYIQNLIFSWKTQKKTCFLLSKKRSSNTHTNKFDAHDIVHRNLFIGHLKETNSVAIAQTMLHDEWLNESFREKKVTESQAHTAQRAIDESTTDTSFLLSV